jgi:hypothetical protein
VHRTGSPSWRFEVGTATALSVALRCRDELGTPVPPSPDVPPGTALPARTTAPDAGLAVAWLVWWHLLLDRTAAGMRPDRLPGDQRHLLVPDALALVAGGPLRELAADAADRHTADARRTWTPPRGDVRPSPPLLSWVLRDAVFDTAGRHDVPAEDLWGGVHLVPGPVGWSAVVRPGYGLMTDPGDVVDEGAQYRFVRAVLESGIRTG